MIHKDVKKIEYLVPKLRRELKARHLTMIAIGGSIGTGLFVASGTIVSQSGPGGALLSYSLIGLMVYFLMTGLGELAAFMPVSGSFYTYGTKYVEEGFGFALGWNYWYNWAITIAVDLVASQFVMSYWFPTIPGWIWSFFFLSLMFLLNYISVKGFGEAEYWFSLIKVITVIVFISIGILMIFGIIKGGENSGFKNFIIDEAPFVGGFSAIVNVAMIVGFSFQGTELIGIIASESKNPRKNIPYAIRQVFWRILLFYILTILIISIMMPYKNLQLLYTNIINSTLSPFTLIFKNAGLLSSATIMNIVILIAILSAGNSGMYAATRMLFTLATEGKAPRIFSKLSHSGVPRNALYITTIIAAFCFLSSMFGNNLVYLWLLNTSGMTGFIAWLGIAISHYRFRRGYILQGYDLNQLSYYSYFFPFGPIFAFFLCLMIILGQNYHVFLENKIDWYNVISTYICIPLFLIIWFGYKIIKGSHIIKYEKMNFKKK
ncbi:Lysine-specific permease [Serratia symbiotica]|nr:Lysine-specific permease [Serratia symbiotica]